MNLKKSGIRWSQPYQSPTLSTDTPCPEAERLVTTANFTPKTTNSNSLLPNIASIDIQQHVNNENSGDVDIRNLTVTLIRTVVLQMSWYQMPGCLYQVRVITVFTVFRLLTDFVCLYNYEFWLSLCKIARSSVILLLPLFNEKWTTIPMTIWQCGTPRVFK